MNVEIELTAEHLIALMKGTNLYHTFCGGKTDIQVCIRSPVDGFVIAKNEYRQILNLLQPLISSNDSLKEVLKILTSTVPVY